MSMSSVKPIFDTNKTTPNNTPSSPSEGTLRKSDGAKLTVVQKTHALDTSPAQQASAKKQPSWRERLSTRVCACYNSAISMLSRPSVQVAIGIGAAVGTVCFMSWFKGRQTQRNFKLAVKLAIQAVEPHKLDEEFQKSLFLPTTTEPSSNTIQKIPLAYSLRQLGQIYTQYSNDRVIHLSKKYPKLLVQHFPNENALSNLSKTMDLMERICFSWIQQKKTRAVQICALELRDHFIECLPHINKGSSYDGPSLRQSTYNTNIYDAVLKARSSTNSIIDYLTSTASIYAHNTLGEEIKKIKQ